MYRVCRAYSFYRTQRTRCAQCAQCAQRAQRASKNSVDSGFDFGFNLTGVKLLPHKSCPQRLIWFFIPWGGWLQHGSVSCACTTPDTGIVHSGLPARSARLERIVDVGIVANRFLEIGRSPF